MNGRRTSSPTKIEYTINPIHLSEESSRVLHFFLEHYMRHGQRKFEASSYSIPDYVLPQQLSFLTGYAGIKLTECLYVRRLNAPEFEECFPRDFAIDVYSGKTLDLKLGSSCKLEHVMGTLKYVDDSYRYTAHEFYALDLQNLSAGQEILFKHILQFDLTKNPKIRQGFLSPSTLYSFKSLGLNASEVTEDFNIQICQTLLRSTSVLIKHLAPQQPLELYHFHYYIYSTELIGQGAYGVVSAVPSKFSFDTNKTLQVTHYEGEELRVSKLQDTNKCDEKSIIHEYLRTKQARKPIVKRPIFMGSTSVMLMRIVPDYDLKTILDNDKVSRENTPIKASDMAQRFMMIVMALRVYLKQIHARRLLAGDLKLENLRFDREGRPTFLDFGFAKNRDEMKVDNSPIGVTPIYAAPESLADNAILTVESEVFTFAWIIFQILGGEVNKQSLTSAEIRDRANNFHKTLAANPLIRILATTLDEKQAKGVIEILERMFAPTAKTRPTFDDVLTFFEDILFDRKFPNKKMLGFSDIELAYKHGRSLRRKLFNFSQKHMLITKDVTTELLQIFNTQLEKVVDRQNCLQEFIDTADLAMCKSTTDTKKALLERVGNVIKAFNVSYDILINFQTDIKRELGDTTISEPKKLSLLKSDNLITKLLQEMHQPVMLDVIFELNAKLDKALLKIQCQRDSFSPQTEKLNAVDYAGGAFVRFSPSVKFLFAPHPDTEYSSSSSAERDVAGSQIHGVPNRNSVPGRTSLPKVFLSDPPRKLSNTGLPDAKCKENAPCVHSLTIQSP